MTPAEKERAVVDYGDHPGHDANDCDLRISVTAHPYGTSRNGYACSASGGHCLPGNYCVERRKEFLDAD